MGKIGRFMVITVGSLTLLQAFGMSLSGLLTFGGIGGLRRKIYYPTFLEA
jgi:MscS family membrane protein